MDAEDPRMAKNRAAVSLGRRGGKAKTEAKAAAVRENGKKGGRPRMTVEQAIRMAIDWAEGRRRRGLPLDADALIAEWRGFRDG